MEYLSILDRMRTLIQEAESLEFEDKVSFLNESRRMLHEISPFKNHPVDYVRWAKAETVQANDYNPNHVAPKEMDLLRISIRNSGYTQPIVVAPDVESSNDVVVDGFHRNIVGRTTPDIQKELHGYLPLTDLTGKTRSERQAATIEHNRARGKHEVDGMGEIVRDMLNQGVSEADIAEKLGMTAEELLRLEQFKGVAAALANTHYARAWVAVNDDEINGLQGDACLVQTESGERKNILPE